MTLFTDDQPRPTAAREKSARAGWILLLSGVVGALALSFIPAPYAIERPGPVFDTLGTVTVSEEEVPLISIPGETTYPTSGSLDMLTVNLVGNRENRPSWIEVVRAWADRTQAVVPLAAVFPEGRSDEQSKEQSSIDMANSQKDAVAASLKALGYDLSATLTVQAFSTDSPSDGVLEEGDQVVSVNGRIPADVTDLRGIIADNGTDEPASVDVRRNGADLTVSITPVEAPNDQGPVFGISVSTDYDFPFDVKIQLENVGGPSAGMMFALGIMDKLTPGELTGGKDFAGTGTITADGQVGPIGGIRQKLYGAKDSGAEFFLAPADNCDEVAGHIPDGLRVFSVATLDQALDAVEAASTGVGLDAVPGCTAD